MAHTPRPAHDTPPDSPSTKQLGVRVPLHLNDRLEAIAKAESNNISSVVRRLLTAALNGDEAA